VYLLRRQASMAFAAGCASSPAAGVDPRDFDHAVAWAGPSPASWARRLGSDEATARALVCAAVRETFEESGVLLAGPSATSVVADTTGDDWEADRLALEAGSCRSPTSWTQRGLVLRYRPARRVVRVADAGVRAAAVPDLVLRRRPARRDS
jgi:8-oxo-dGTP pyrophosphatase MutT (NUDIX family)